ncbi:hypothetical protein, partial [Segatella asaccharophila]
MEYTKPVIKVIKLQYESFLAASSGGVNIDENSGTITGHQHSSVLVYPKIKETLYMKKGRSETPCSCALNLLSLELSDS